MIGGAEVVYREEPVRVHTLIAAALLCVSCASGWRGLAERTATFDVEVSFPQEDESVVVVRREGCEPGVLVRFSSIREFLYVGDYDVEPAQCDFIVDPLIEAEEVGTWLDLTPEWDRDGLVRIEIALARRSIRRPIGTFTTTLGALTTSVTIPVPEFLEDECRVSDRLRPGVESRVRTFPDTPDPSEVLVRVSVSRATDCRSGSRE
jgi:hypothetical protein